MIYKQVTPFDQPPLRFNLKHLAAMCKTSALGTQLTSQLCLTPE